jgi:hypothetical protein
VVGTSEPSLDVCLRLHDRFSLHLGSCRTETGMAQPSLRAVLHSCCAVTVIMIRCAIEKSVRKIGGIPWNF